MNVGEKQLAQVMELVPCETFSRVVDRLDGDAGDRALGCADMFRVMAFAQLPWRESLRDVEACLAANRGKLLHMGLKAPPMHSKLWPMQGTRTTGASRHALAQRLILEALILYRPRTNGAVG